MSLKKFENKRGVYEQGTIRHAALIKSNLRDVLEKKCLYLLICPIALGSINDNLHKSLIFTWRVRICLSSWLVFLRRHDVYKMFKRASACRGIEDSNSKMERQHARRVVVKAKQDWFRSLIGSLLTWLRCCPWNCKSFLGEFALGTRCRLPGLKKWEGTSSSYYHRTPP